MNSVRIQCQCGARLSEPLPTHCPQCRRKIGKVQQGRGAWVVQIAVFVAFFGILLGTLYYLVNHGGGR